MYVIDCIKDKKIDLNFYNRHCLRFYVYIILSLFIHCLFFNYNCENFLNEVITPAQDTNAQNVTTIHTETYSNKDNNADELGSIKNNSNVKNSTNNKTLVLCENNIAAIGQVQIGNYNDPKVYSINDDGNFLFYFNDNCSIEGSCHDEEHIRLYRLQDGRINGYRIVNSKFKAYACLYDDLDCKDDDLVSCLQEGRYNVVREENNDENVEVNSNKYIVALVTVKKRNSSSNAVPLNDMSYYINHYDVYLERYNMCYGNYDDGETVFSLNDSNESRYIVYLENVDSIEDKGMCYGLFQDSNATEIEILSCGDDIIDMQFMFSNCNNLTKLDVSKLNTCHVTDMGYMFSFCYRLQVLDLSNFDITNVKNVSYMFSCCTSLTSLIFPNCDKNTIANMSNMFACM